jgi:uncharacterized membrane protein (UPF0127 family)
LYPCHSFETSDRHGTASWCREGHHLTLIREAGAQGITFQTTNLTLVTRTERYDFTVNVANNNTSQTDRGLRYLHEIPPDGGLLLLQSQAAPGPISVSTAGQALPVDLLFIAADGTVMEVHYCIPTDSDTRSLRRVRSRRRSRWPVVQ